LAQETRNRGLIGPRLAWMQGERDIQGDRDGETKESERDQKRGAPGRWFKGPRLKVHPKRSELASGDGLDAGADGTV
jgi:hypothetical protein